MSFAFDLNNVVEREVDALLAWKDALKANGMTVESSGDGNGGTFGASSDVLTVANSGDAVANNIGNRQAWFRGSWPNGREMVWQHSNNVNQGGGHLRYSAADGFIGSDDGAPSATVAPTAGDQAFVMGDLITSDVHLFSTALASGTGLPADEAGRGVIGMCFGNVDEDYAWYALQWVRGNREARGGMWMDALSGSPSYVADPVAVGIVGDDSGMDLVTASMLFDGRQDGTPDGSNNKSFAWAQQINAGMDRKMLSAYLMQYGHDGNPGQQITNPAFPANGVITGLSEWTDSYDLYGMGQWFIAGRTDTDRGRTSYLGQSRLFQMCALAHAARDMSDDLLWRFSGSLAVRWDGTTGQVLL